jgi:hypothetical protein
MAAAIAVPVAKYVGANVAAYLASKGADYAINRGIPKAFNAARKYTYKRSEKSKFHRKAYRALTGAEKAYHGGAGRLVRNVANTAVNAAVAYKTGRYLKKLRKK